MALAIFDLDHTLLNGDSDYLWGEYMVAHDIVDAETYRSQNQQFLEDYQCGQLDNEIYLEFALKPLSRHSIEQLTIWRADFVENWIRPIIAKSTPGILEKHRNRGDTLLVISATNLFVTAPIAKLLDIPHILATEPEIMDNRYTGRYLGTPTFKEGKVTVLQTWLKNQPLSLDGSFFYSDSINDLPLLEQVTTAVTVSPDAALLAIAEQKGWPVIDLEEQFSR